MILLFDVGNSNIVLGISENKKIKSTYRFITNSNLTEDEYYQALEQQMKEAQEDNGTTS